MSNDTRGSDAIDDPSDGKPRILRLFETAKRDGRAVHVCAPMVRYSKLPFRLLLHDYAVDVVYTPMMLAREFVRSGIARDSDFTTCAAERKSDRAPLLIAQFAASEPLEFARAAEMIEPWVDGVDINCGCPQSWALGEGTGCALMAHPELVARIVTAARARLRPTTSVSCKIRIHPDLTQTLRWVRVLEDAGVDFITVHGRTRSQRSSTPPNLEAIRLIKEHVRVPVIANGDVFRLSDVQQIVKLTGVDGVMAARGILENPALFAGYEHVPNECLTTFLEHAVRSPIPFALVLHHVSEMMAHMPNVSKRDRKELLACHDIIDLIDYTKCKFVR